MQMSQMHYLPLAPGFFAILVGFSSSCSSFDQCVMPMKVSI